MEIRNYCLGDEIKILQLFEYSFGRKMSLDYWNWRFRDNPVGQYYIKLMWDNDKLVGHYAVSPFMFQWQGREEKACLSMTTMTHPDYGGRGIFKDLASDLYKYIQGEYGVKFVMGFPNKNSHYGFLKNLQWNDLAVVHHLILDAKQVNPVKFPCIKQEEIFSQIHVDLLRKINEQKVYSLSHSLDYLKWRYEQNPNNKYYIFDYWDQELKGFLVVKLYPLPDGSFGVFVVENGIPYESMELLPIFWAHIIAVFEQDISTINIWLSIFDKRHIYYEKNGFFIGGKPTFLSYRSFDSSLKGIGDIHNWSYSYGDSDIY